MKLLYQDGGRHGSHSKTASFRLVFPPSFPVVYLSLVSLHFRLTNIEIGLSEIFLFSPLCFPSPFFFSLSLEKNLIGQCCETISIIERSRNVVRRFYCRECIRKKRNFAFKLDVDTLNESGGSGREFGIPWKRGRGREYSSEIKKIPKAKSRFRLKFLTSVSRSLEPV